MDKKTFAISLLLILVIVPVVAAVYATYRHPAVQIADGKDINLFGNAIGNGSFTKPTNLYNTTTTVYATADNTTTLQTALNNKGTIYIAEDITINAVSIYNDTRLVQKKGTKIIRQNSATNDHLLSMNGVHDVDLVGIEIDGGRYTQTGMTIADNIEVRNSYNIRLTDVTSNYANEDGLYVGYGSTPSWNILISNYISYGNLRQGISVTSGYNIAMSNLILHSNDLMGLDLEPNSNTNRVGNISITGAVIYNHTNTTGQGGGVGLSIVNAASDAITGQRVTVTGVHSTNNVLGLYIYNWTDLDFYGNNFDNNSQFGASITRNAQRISFTSNSFSNNKDRGFSLVTSSESWNTTQIQFVGNSFVNNSQYPKWDDDGIRIDGTNKNITRVLFLGNLFTGPYQRYGITATADATDYICANNMNFGNNNGSTLGFTCT